MTQLQSTAYGLLPANAETEAVEAEVVEDLDAEYVVNAEEVDIDTPAECQAQLEPEQPPEPEPQQQAPASNGKRDKMLSRIRDLMAGIGELTDGQRYNEHHLKNKLKKLFWELRILKCMDVRQIA
jgi:hypothetical protein